MNDFFVLLFLAALIWLVIDWRRSHKAGLKLQKRGKWLLVAVIALLVLIGMTAPANSDSKQQSKKETPKAKTSAKSSSQKKAESSSSSSQKKQDDGSSQKTNQGQTNPAILAFTGQRQMVMGDLDSLGRATYSHIQLQDKDEPKVKRAPQLKYNPVGWHNYKFYYGDGSQQAWLMNRGHLVGYQFSGLNDEPRNLVPETAWFNAGNYQGMNDNNADSMLYYENRLDSWLANYPNYWLDYMVTPIYQGSELIPRQVQLAYVGLDGNGQQIAIKLGSSKEFVDGNGITKVILDNSSPNANIDYATGRATNIVSKR